MNSRIPSYDGTNPNGMTLWFAELSARGLLFHPDDNPSDIISIATGKPTFTKTEADEARKILQAMFSEHGNGTIEACYPVFMHACGQRLDA